MRAEAGFDIATEGASAVEFALILPILILLVFGIIQFGIAYNRVQGLQAGAREGARLAAVGKTYDEIQTRVYNASSPFFDTDTAAGTSDIIIDTVPPAAGSQRPCAEAGLDNDVTVIARVEPNPKYAIQIPLWPGSGERAFEASGTFRCEQVSG